MTRVREYAQARTLSRVADYQRAPPSPRLVSGSCNQESDLALGVLLSRLFAIISLMPAAVTTEYITPKFGCRLGGLPRDTAIGRVLTAPNSAP